MMDYKFTFLTYQQVFEASKYSTKSVPYLHPRANNFLGR